MQDRGRFTELFSGEYPGLVRELTLIVGDRGLAEDLAADAFAELWRKWSQVAGHDRPGAWVRRVALRGAGRARWRRGRRGVVERSAASPTGHENAVEVDLRRALAELSYAQRTAVVMHHLGGWPAAEIAGMLGCADVTVRTHLHRGRRRLAELLEPTDMECTDAERR